MSAAARGPDGLAARLIAQGQAELFIDISTLLEDNWTGIPMVAAGMAQALERALPGRVQYFHEGVLVDPAAVQAALAQASGRWLARELRAGRAQHGRLPAPRSAAAGRGTPLRIGYFPSVKTARGAFDIEVLTVHDLSTLITPQFHIHGNIAHHMDRIMGDAASSALIIAVSHATAHDLTAYLGIDPARIRVIHNGIQLPEGAVVAAEALSEGRGVEPYLLVLGTREPRKNVNLVFEMLRLFPDILRTHRMVFAGRMGWKAERHALPEALAAHQQSGRIAFTGFVSEAQKYALLRHASASIYPSLFEGFGLPVLESLAAGTPCAASFSSSIPEIAGGPCCLFDPFSAADMRRAVAELLNRRQALGEAAIRAACLAQAAHFTWPRAAAELLAALDPIIGAARAAGPAGPGRAAQRNAGAAGAAAGAATVADAGAAGASSTGTATSLRRRKGSAKGGS